VLRRPDAGEQGGVARIRNRGQHASHPVGMSPGRQQLPQVGDLEMVLIGRGDVIRLKAVDGNQQEPALRGLAKA